MRGLEIEAAAVSISAPLYSDGRLRDMTLLDRVEKQKPAFVVINLAGGVQERLGLFLRNHLSYRPDSSFCTGAAIAFLSRRQANILRRADPLFLGWLLRILS